MEAAKPETVNPEKGVIKGAKVKLSKTKFNWKRIFFILLGLGIFLWIYFMPQWKDAVDPTGKAFPLSAEGKGLLPYFYWQAYGGFLKSYR